MDIKKETKRVVELLVLCNIVCLSTSQGPLRFLVEGKSKFKTGVRHYTTVMRDEARDVICSTSLPVPTEISLLKSNVDVEDVVYEQELNKISKTFQTSDDIQGNYTCRIKVKVEASERNILSYMFESNLGISDVSSNPKGVCTTSVGKAGFEGEIISLVCMSKLYNGWKQSQKRTLNEVRLSRLNITQYSCGEERDGSWIEKCNLSHVQIFPSLKVEIRPTSFLPDSRYLEFTCTSTPPRLLYWRVFGWNGDIIDLDRYNTSLMVDTNITIKQSVGETTLYISESIPGGNGICHVVCFTYSTTMTAADAFLTQQSSDGSQPSCDGFILSTVLLTVVIVIVIQLLVVLMVVHVKKRMASNADFPTDAEPSRPEQTYEEVIYAQPFSSGSNADKL